MRYVEDNKQRFEVIVIPRDLSKVVLKLAHDDLGHNGSARTYMVVRRNYYWKGLRSDVVRYVKRCTICRKYNSASPKYNKGTFQAPGVPMDFISMDLIGEFHPPPPQHTWKQICLNCYLHAVRLDLVHSNPGQDRPCGYTSLSQTCPPCFWTLSQNTV